MFKSRSTPFDELVLRATDEKNVTEDWALIIEICDKATNYEEGPRLCLQAITKRLHHNVPRVAMQSLNLLDACVKNCGKRFLLEVSSRNFVAEITKLMSKMNVTTADRLKQLLRKWAENDFKDDAELGLIPSLYYKLKSEGVEFPPESEEPKKQVTACADPDAVSSQEEEEAIIKAIELSLKETTKSNTNFKDNSQPQDKIDSNVPAAEPTKVRALYDFEAVEDNELTVKAGEIVFVLDKSNESWWKGSNHRGEGYFPSNFVAENLDASPEVSDSANTDEEETLPKEIEPSIIEHPIVIDEEKIQKTLDLLNGKDPTSDEPDSEEMLELEKECAAMVPLIEDQLQQIDKKFSLLNSVNEQLMDALEVFYTLDSTATNMWAGYNLYKQNSASHAEKPVNMPQPSNNETITMKTGETSLPVQSHIGCIPVAKQVVEQKHQPTSTPSSQSSSSPAANPVIWYHPSMGHLPPTWGPVALPTMPLESKYAYYAPVVSQPMAEVVVSNTSSKVKASVAGDSNISMPYIQVASHYADSIPLGGMHSIPPQYIQPIYASPGMVPQGAAIPTTDSLSATTIANGTVTTVVNESHSVPHVTVAESVIGTSGSAVDANSSKPIGMPSNPQVSLLDTPSVVTSVGPEGTVNQELTPTIAANYVQVSKTS